MSTPIILVLQMSLLFILAEIALDVADSAQNEPMTNPPEFQALFIKTLLLVGVLLALTFIALWVLKRVGGGRFETSRRDSVITVIERKPLTPKVSLWVVEIDSTRYLITESGNGIHTVRLPQMSEEKV